MRVFINLYSKATVMRPRELKEVAHTTRSTVNQPNKTSLSQVSQAGGRGVNIISMPLLVANVSHSKFSPTKGVTVFQTCSKHLGGWDYYHSY